MEDETFEGYTFAARADWPLLQVISEHRALGYVTPFGGDETAKKFTVSNARFSD